MDGESLQDLADEVLAERFKESRKEEYFTEIERRFARRIYSACLHVLHDSAAAEDILQETFIKVLTKIESFEGGNFGAWIRRIAVNLSINCIKSAQKAHESVGLAFEVAEDRNLEGQVVSGEAVQVVLAQLPEAQRVALKLFFIHQYTYKEIAATTKSSVEEVTTRVQNGKRRFRLAWAEAVKSS